jgi:hypothetical protein
MASEIPPEAVRAAMERRADLLSDRPDPTVLSDETLTRKMLEAAAPLLAEERKCLGYVVITYDPRSRRPFIGFMHGSRDDATKAREGMSATPGERHVVAEVLEVPEVPLKAEKDEGS